jgi:hypothetical protein
MPRWQVAAGCSVIRFCRAEINHRTFLIGNMGRRMSVRAIKGYISDMALVSRKKELGSHG